VKSIFLAISLALLMPIFLGADDDIGKQIKPCRDQPLYAQLDFWLGNWRVELPDGSLAGFNRIEKILDGCAVLEHWTSSQGNQGKSLFYVLGDHWRQVWVTEQTMHPGGVKEKHQQTEYETAGIRFQGKIIRNDGTSYLDRTTLTVNPDGSVRQNIEWSEDQAKTWKSVFDARYIRAGLVSKPQTDDD